MKKILLIITMLTTGFCNMWAGVPDDYFSTDYEHAKWLSVANASDNSYVMFAMSGTMGTRQKGSTNYAVYQLVAFVGNKNGFKIYSYSNGSTKALYAANSDSGTAVSWVDPANASTWTLDERYIGASKPGYGICLNGNTSTSLNMYGGANGDCKFWNNGETNHGSHWQIELADNNLIVENGKVYKISSYQNSGSKYQIINSSTASEVINTGATISTNQGYWLCHETSAAYTFESAMADGTYLGWEGLSTTAETYRLHFGTATNNTSCASLYRNEGTGSKYLYVHSNTSEGTNGWNHNSAVAFQDGGSTDYVFEEVTGVSVYRVITNISAASVTYKNSYTGTATQTNGGFYVFEDATPPTASDFTVTNYGCQTSKVTVDTDNKTITVTYTQEEIPSDYNTYIGEATVDETKWKTQSNWNLASGASWKVGPGYNGSDMWQPIYLKGVTATGIQLEGWAFSANLIKSSLTANTNKIQGNWTINVAEDSELILTMTSSTSHTDDGTHTFNINGSMTINAQPNRFNGTQVSDNCVNIGENGHFELISSSNLSINNSASFTINVTPTEPTNYNEVLSQETPFAVIQNVTFADGKLTFGKIDPNNKWTKVDEDELLHQTVPGNYYSIVETTETGTKKYYLHTYKYNSIYSRNVTSGNFGSICIPNAVAEIDGIEKVLAVTKVGTDRVEMDEVDVDDMVAGVPYIFKSNKNTISLTVTGESVANPVNNTQTYLVGNFGTPVYVPNSDEYYSYYVLQSNQFKKVTSASTIKSGSNRCYLKVPVTSQSRMSTLGIAVDEGGATGIDALNALINNNAEIYDINGRKLKDLRKGINIVNGVKVLVK